MKPTLHIICWIIIIVASFLSIRATVFGLESLLEDDGVPILVITMVILVQATLVVAGTQMFSSNNLVYRAAYLMATIFSITFGISYFLVYAGLEEQIIQEQFSEAKNQLSDNIEHSKATLDEFQTALNNLTEHSIAQANREKITGGTCQNAEYVGQGPRYRLRTNDAKRLKLHARQVSDVNGQLSGLSQQLANTPSHRTNILRQLTIQSGSLIKSRRITDAQQWVNERINKREHRDEQTGQYFLCSDSIFDSLGGMVASVELRSLDIPDLHQSRKGSGFKVTGLIWRSLLTLNFEKITPYHLLSILFTFLVEGVVLLMLYALHQKKSSLQEHLNNMNKIDQISDRFIPLLGRITHNYRNELIDLQKHWNDKDNHYRANVQMDTRGAELALCLERLGIAKKVDTWISKIAAMSGHQRKYRKFKFNKPLMQDLLIYQTEQQTARSY